MRLVGLVVALIACGAPRQAPSPSKPATAACDTAPARALIAEGRLARGAAALRTLQPACPDDATLAQELARITGELAVAGDPDELVREAQKARAAGDELAARRLFEVALANAERRGGSAQIVSASAFITSWMQWSTDGRWAVLRERGPDHWDGAIHLVNPTTGAHFYTERGGDSAISPDGKYLAVKHRGKLEVFELGSGKQVLADRGSVANPQFASDGRLVWGELHDAQAIVYLRDLDTGSEVALRAPAVAPTAVGQQRHVFRIELDADGFIVTWSQAEASDRMGTFRIWKPSGNSFVLQHTLEYASPYFRRMDVDGDWLVAVADQGSRLRLQLARRSGVVTSFSSPHKVCGNGWTGMFEDRPLRCDNTLVIARQQTGCQWDIASGRLVRTWSTGEVTRASCDARKFKAERPSMRSMRPDHVSTVQSPAPSVTDRDGTVSARLGGQLVPLDDSKDFGVTIAPDQLHVLGVSQDRDRVRGRIWDATGKIMWRSLEQPEPLAGVGFDSAGNLVAVYQDTTIWHLVLDPLAVRTTAATPNCRLYTFAVLPDDRVAFACNTNIEPPLNVHVRIEGVADTVLRLHYSTHEPVFSASAQHASAIAIDDKSMIRVWSLPDGKERWSSRSSRYELASKWVTPSGERALIDHSGELSIRDATGKEVAAHNTPSTRIFALRDDGTAFVTGERYPETLDVRDTAGTIIETLAKARGAAAFGPAGLIAFPHLEQPTLVVHDLAAHREHGVRRFPFMPTHVDQVTWSRDGAQLAVLADAHLFVWGKDGALRAQILSTGTGFLVLGPDGKLRSLGDGKRAGDLLACRIGNWLYPLELCEDRLVE